MLLAQLVFGAADQLFQLSEFLELGLAHFVSRVDRFAQFVRVTRRLLNLFLLYEDLDDGK